MKTLVHEALLQTEKEHDIKILYAVESGSRAWGFESTDSDWDVRFIYIHKTDWYLSIDDQRDTIEKMLPNDIDIAGWELRKALRLFRKSNPPMLEWLMSPMVYLEQYSTATQLRKLTEEYFNSRACLHHYYNMGSGNVKDYLQGDVVKMKKYFYVLRPLMACLWIEKYNTPPPMLFQELVDDLVLDKILYDEIAQLLERKKAGEELGLEPKNIVLQEYIDGMVKHIHEILVRTETPTAPDTEKLNVLFRATLNDVWGTV